MCILQDRKTMGGFTIKALKGSFLLSFVWILLVGCSGNQNENYGFIKIAERKINHVHGLGYTGEEGELYVATHEGLVKYSDGAWLESTTNNHDYMGFQMVDEGFYSSGHPEVETPHKNPLGIVKSTDEGKTLDEVAFYGESDFHAVGYYSGAIYLINEQPNSKLYVGVFYSKDSGNTWSTSKLKGLTSKSISKIATHPTREELLGISTKDGLFYSSDYGDNFDLVSDRDMVTTLYFEEDSLLYTTLKNGTVRLHDLRMNNGTRAEIPLPGLVENQPITEISSNPSDRNELVLITQKNDIFLSEDRGKNWRQIATKGKLG